MGVGIFSDFRFARRGVSLISEHSRELEDYGMFEWGRGILCHSVPRLYAAANWLSMCVLLGDTQSLISASGE